MADSENDGPITREKKPRPAETPAAAPAPAASTPAAPGTTAHSQPHDESTCAGCARLRSALRETRKRLRRMIAENRTLREELLSAGEMIEDLATDIERPL